MTTGGLAERRGVGCETAMYVWEGLGVQQGDWGALCFISGLSRTIRFDGYYLRRRIFKSFVVTSINLEHYVLCGVSLWTSGIFMLFLVGCPCFLGLSGIGTNRRTSNIQRHKLTLTSGPGA